MVDVSAISRESNTGWIHVAINKKNKTMLDDIALTPGEHYQLALARQEIEYLRRLYGRATDALGKVDDEESVRFGVETYHRIFTDDVKVRVTGSANPLEGEGPEAWIQVVTNALKDFETTQHLIGTQLVQFEDVKFDGASIVCGDATMSSYLHAWHAWPDRKVRVVLGTYEDKVKFTASKGWQIYDMTLQHASAEHRMLGDLSV